MTPTTRDTECSVLNCGLPVDGTVTFPRIDVTKAYCRGHIQKIRARAQDPHLEGLPEP